MPGPQPPAASSASRAPAAAAAALAAAAIFASTSTAEVALEAVGAPSGDEPPSEDEGDAASGVCGMLNASAFAAAREGGESGAVKDAPVATALKHARQTGL